MKYCTSCGKEIQDRAAFCPACGTKQLAVETAKPFNKLGEETEVEIAKSSASALVVLCILTILGSVLGIIRGVFYEWIGSMGRDSSDNFYMFGAFSIIANIGTLAGAIMMLNRRLTGYTFYMIFQVIGIIVILLRTAQFNSENDSHRSGDDYISTVTFFIAAAFIIPSVLFMILYTSLGKKHLR